jgi:hypothetical protein
MLHKPDEAEQFLREGLRANPGSCEILFELGRIYAENRHDPVRARNLWEAALRQWDRVEAKKPKPNEFALGAILTQLYHLEATERNYRQALAYLVRLKPYSPNPAAVQQLIDGVQAKLRGGSPDR